MPSYRRFQTFLMSAAAAAAFLIALPGGAAAADIPKSDQIRVALYLDNGKYNVTTPFVTLSAAQGLDAALGAAAGFNSVASGLTAVRAMADKPLLILLETTDVKQAQALAQKLSDTDKPAGVIGREKSGETLYQVYAGPYPTKETAQAAKDTLLKQAAVAQAVKDFTPYVAGALHWNAGTYTDEADAAAQVSAIAQAGFDVDLAYMDNGGKLQYAALIGNESDNDGLNSLKQKVSGKLPNVTLQPVSAATPYVLKRTEGGGKASGNATDLWAVGAGAKLKVTTQQDGIKVAEKAARSYRGSLELSQLNSKLAVVNELPMEDYVTSVVGSELGSSWPAEALKAQAVAARTFALKQGAKYGVAQVSDSSSDQVYKGIGGEAPAIAEAVKATEGELLADKDGLITPFFYSNAGGMTADPVEVWGKPISYLQSVPSPDDGAETTKTVWLHVVMPNGNMGYITSAYAKDTGKKNDAGLPYYESTGNAVNVRSGPGTDSPSLFKVNTGDRFAVLDQAPESNAYSWVRGPVAASSLLDKINAVLDKPITGKLESLEVTARGPSGRVTEMKANGQTLKVANPDALRTVLGGLPSTRFEIEEAGSYTIWGANGTTAPSAPQGTSSQTGSQPPASIGPSQPPAAQSAESKPLPIGTERAFIFKGKGNGHGLGMSQWGARGYALLGYDYKQILQAYYVGVTILKE
ncbi:SpoIID/LytB domain-containing protein [Paenibacillus thalictri]|nr:SpoIID/LytB domain-containing protein [Paenibacillus thalictri]